MPLALDEVMNQPILIHQRAQDLGWEDVLYEYERALDDEVALLKGLSEDQVHFKPAAAAYSIAEVVTHAAEADRLVWSWVRLLLSGQRAAIDPAALIPGDGARNDLAFEWLYGEIETCRSIARDAIATLPDLNDLESTAPHPYFGELNAKGWLYWMIVHHGLHLQQCVAVVDAPGFPRSVSVQTQPREAYRPSERKTWLVEKEKGKKQDTRRKMQDTGSEKRSAKSSATKKHPTSKQKTTPRSK